LVRGAPLKGKNLRYARAFRAFFVNADLRGADLFRADLREADLRGALLQPAVKEVMSPRFVFEQLQVDFSALIPTASELSEYVRIAVKDHSAHITDLREAYFESANLEGTSLWWANLEGARLGFANLERANLWWANLHNTLLIRANLREADLRWANLRGAELADARLDGAQLTNTNLQTANLRGVHGLSRERLQNASNWVLAFYSEDVLEELKLPPDHNKRVLDKNLSGANLQGLKLIWADLREADLRGADLRDADLRKAQLGNARLEGANLSGANLWETCGLTPEQLASALTDANTQLPLFYRPCSR
jgi:uncharacterized protein YjbI with pentapeptide repeats